MGMFQNQTGPHTAFYHCVCFGPVQVHGPVQNKRGNPSLNLSRKCDKLYVQRKEMFYWPRTVDWPRTVRCSVRVYTPALADITMAYEVEAGDTIRVKRSMQHTIYMAENKE